MVKYPESEEKFITPKTDPSECQYRLGLGEKLTKRLTAAGVYVDKRCIINEFKEVIPPLLGITEVAAILGWDKRKVSVYVQRNVLPDPSIHIGDRPIWTIKQIEEWMNDEKNKKYLG
ncbi:hypothetical protein [Acetivibrio cellulolyticus]|uniref:hypothetical protein n=1 Tax=Acetivibrio cellulolyticus TaxID=35830 RepID=UPI0001E2C7A7|nr:hypothetical protein [Acetivibrio cellulolyticus]